MQSGIKASIELHTAFNDFTSTRSSFCLPVTIASESLQPLDPIPCSSSSSSSYLSTSLASLKPHVQPKTPIYLLIRPNQDSNDLTAVTYVPSLAPVRAKTLFASTRATLVRELGIEKFSSNLFCTEAEEVLDPKQWAEREKADGGGVDAALLTREERELGEIRRVEQEERHGTQGHDLMGTHHDSSTTGEGSSGLKMKATGEATDGLRTLAQTAHHDGGRMLVLGIDLPTEMIALIASHAQVPPDRVSAQIPATQPSYTFYHYPSTNTVVFIYTCPSASKIKQRMVYASARAFVLKIAEGEGVSMAKRIEAGEAEEVDERRLMEEVMPKGEEENGNAGSSSRGGFARPKRPGRR